MSTVSTCVQCNKCKRVQDLMAGRIAEADFVAGLVQDQVSCVVYMDSMTRVRDANMGLGAAAMTTGLAVLNFLTLCWL